MNVKARTKTNFNAFDLARDAELALLGGMMVSSHLPEVATIGTRVDVSDFADDSLGKLFSILCDLQDEGLPLCDIGGIVRQRVIEKEIYDDLGGGAGLAELVRKACTNPAWYAGKVRRLANKRRMISAVAIAKAELEDHTEDPYATAEKLASTLDALSARREIKFESIGDISSKILDELDKPKKPLIQTGLAKFDRVLGGFAPGELIILAARTSIGKSALAAQIAEHNAEKRLPVLFVTLEMESADIVRRILSRRSKVNVKAMRSGNLSSQERTAILSAAVGTDSCTLFPHYMPTAKAREIRQVTKAFAAEHGVGLLVVDYLQIVKGPDVRMGIREAVGDTTRTLKRLAGELDCPVLALSQLNRDSTKQDSPTLANMAESSSIEADADMVLAIHRRSPQEQEGELLVLKNRNGETVDLTDFMWSGQAMQFWFKGDQQFSGFENYR